MSNIKEMTITELSTKLRNKKLSVKELVQEYIKQIETIDQGADGFNSVLEINPEIMEIVEKLDEQHMEEKSKLFGVPILLKDNIDTADRMHTSAGSLALADSFATEDAEHVKRLRDKGAVILGKTNMTEFANYMTTGMPAGFSSRGGQVKSPYKKEADPSGSSTGSAVAVTANLCMASIGTDTSNSIVSPALTNGIVGFRPSMGAISQKGIIPISFTCDTAGPMTRTVTDASILFQEITGITVNMEEKPELKDLKVGMNEWALKNLNAEEGKKADTIISELEKAGVQIKRLDMEPIPTNHIKTIQKYEFKYAMNRYLSGLPEDYPIRSLKDIIAFNHQNSDRTLQFGQTLLLDAEENTRGDLSENEYIELLKEREHYKKQIYELLRTVDVCIMFRENLMLQYTGLPIITIPRGLYNDGMPYGITLSALADNELLKHAASIEELIGNRVGPRL
jgi:amidase